MKNELIPAPVLVCVEPNPGLPRRSERLTEEKRWRVIHLNTDLQLGPQRLPNGLGSIEILSLLSCINTSRQER